MEDLHLRALTTEIQGDRTPQALDRDASEFAHPAEEQGLEQGPRRERQRLREAVSVRRRQDHRRSEQAESVEPQLDQPALELALRAQVERPRSGVGAHGPEQLEVTHSCTPARLGERQDGVLVDTHEVLARHFRGLSDAERADRHVVTVDRAAPRRRIEDVDGGLRDLRGVQVLHGAPPEQCHRFDVGHQDERPGRMTANGSRRADHDDRSWGVWHAGLRDRRLCGGELLSTIAEPSGAPQSGPVHRPVGNDMSIRVCINGVSGWTGSAVARGVLAAPDFELTAGVARSVAGQDIGSILGLDAVGITVAASVEEALATAPDVMIDYTHPTAVRGHVEVAVEAGVACIVGTSGLTKHDYEELGAMAESAGVGVIAAGNFSLTAALAKHFAGIAARYVPHWEVVDYGHGGKPDAPSGTARELADYLGEVATNQLELPIDEVHGARDARGASIGGAQVHSVRLPGYVLSFEALFGLPDERLSIRHDAGSGAEPYVAGTLLAARKVGELTGPVRGLDTLLFG